MHGLIDTIPSKLCNLFLPALHIMTKSLSTFLLPIECIINKWSSNCNDILSEIINELDITILSNQTKTTLLVYYLMQLTPENKQKIDLTLISNSNKIIEKILLKCPLDFNPEQFSEDISLQVQQLKEKNITKINLTNFCPQLINYVVKKYLDQLNIENVQQINYQRSDFDRMMDIFKQKQQKRKSKLQKLDQEVSDSKTKYNCLLQNINKLKSALLEAQKEKSLIESKAKDEIAEALQQRNVYNLLISEIIEKKSQNLINKENLLHRKQEIEKEIMGIEKELEKIDVTITEWKAKLKAKNQIKQYAFDDIDNQTRILVRLREECQTDDIETYLDMKQKENDFLLTENKRLESRLRVTLKNILNIQNENQDLKAKILLYNR